MINQPTKIKEHSIDVESALYEITELGISCESMQEYYEKVHHIVGKLTPAANFFIALYDQHIQEVKFVYFVDEVDTDFNVENLQVLTQEGLKKSATEYLLQSGELLHLNATNLTELYETGVLKKHGTPP